MTQCSTYHRGNAIVIAITALVAFAVIAVTALVPAKSQEAPCFTVQMMTDMVKEAELSMTVYDEKESDLLWKEFTHAYGEPPWENKTNIAAVYNGYVRLNFFDRVTGCYVGNLGPMTPDVWNAIVKMVLGQNV